MRAWGRGAIRHKMTAGQKRMGKHLKMVSFALYFVLP